MPNKDIGKIHIHLMRILLFIIILLITKSICAQNALDLLSNNGSNAVSPHQAIQVSDYSEKNKLITIWDIPKGFYLYKNQFKFTLSNAPNAQIGAIDYPDAVNKNDPNLGQQ
ncbi:protein-disulfide reductase DsbD family protein, partial [Francisellaceae bacterium]|nr:protein-disulfide reductase DsbD family protein [Francisellaceae bacterium]